jgi:hypothetical protein
MTEIVSTAEYNYSAHAANKLRGITCVRQLVKEFDEISARTVSVDDKSKLFEIRYAYYLVSRGFEPTYEFKTGVGDSSVDFFVDGKPSWLLELVSLRPSDAVKRATVTTGNLSEMELSSNKRQRAKDKGERQGLSTDECKRLASEAAKESIEGEILRAQRQLGEKVMKKANNHKFPPATPESVSCIVVDGRGFCAGGDNYSEFKFMCTGQTDEFMGSEEIIYYWEGEPILGIFDAANERNNSPTIRERIHVMHFISEEEKHFTEGGIEDASVYFCVNGLLGKVSELSPCYPGPLQGRPRLAQRI